MKVNKKFMRRITSFAVVVVLAMSLSLFSVTAYAETLDDFSINFDYGLYHPNTGNYYSRIDVDIENYSTYLYEHEPVGSVPMDYAMQMVFTATIENNNGSLLLKSGEAFDLSISGLSLWVLIAEQNLYKWNGVPASMFVGLVYTDGTWTHLRDVNWVYSSRTDTHAIEVSGTTDKDVTQIVFYEEINQYTVTGVHGVRTASLGMGGVGTPTAIEVEIQSKEVGLLEDIGDQIDSAINGTPQQNQQAQDAVNGLTGSVGKLDDIGDQMASVEKPSFDNSNISADSLVPDTSLILFASPFQALWENKQLLAMLTIVVTVVLISWVFFGKKA